MEYDLKILDKRRKKLNAARKYLKTQFIGIDDIIDKFIDSVKVWYILPEVLTRPVIINLWGITGVGKTDLVRKFIKFIEMNDKFTEIQMDSREGTAKIEDYLDNTMESHDSQGILLLDEIQRFRTINEEGLENNTNKFQDVWMLLSDGMFQSNAEIKKELMNLIMMDQYWAERGENDADDLDDLDEEKKKAVTLHTSVWEANRVKRLLKLTESLDEIMKWTPLERMDRIKKALNSIETYEGKKYSKLLIIISGNLDEAFKMAKNVNDADRDADVYHDFSKKIDIIKIKEALTNRFKPEQIARFGNNHLIYPVPSKAAYKGIINQKINNILTHIKDQQGINISVDDSVLKAVYDNGVFPTQGVRPVISTISSMVENTLPNFIYEYLKTEDKGDINIRFKNGNLVSKIGDKKVKVSVPTVLDDIKEEQNINEKTLVAVHEAGHAIAYAIRFKIVPTQIVASTLDVSTGGFVGIHDTLDSRGQIFDDLIITLAGRAAEETVFPYDYISTGASGDLTIATNTAVDYVRQNGMHHNLGVSAPEKEGRSFKIVEESENMIIERIIKKSHNKALDLISNNLDFLIEVADALLDRSELSKEEFFDIAIKYVEGLKIINNTDTIDVNYLKEYNKFKNKSEK